MWLRSTIRNKGRSTRSSAAARARPTRGLEVDFGCIILGILSQKYTAVNPKGTYFFSGVAKPCKRQAEEMRETANTVREPGLTPGCQHQAPKRRTGLPN